MNTRKNKHLSYCLLVKQNYPYPQMVYGRNLPKKCTDLSFDGTNCAWLALIRHFFTFAEYSTLIAKK